MQNSFLPSLALPYNLQMLELLTVLAIIRERPGLITTAGVMPFVIDSQNLIYMIVSSPIMSGILAWTPFLLISLGQPI